MTKARTIADLGTGFVNITDTGTEGTKFASGTTAQRGSTQGQFRYNTTTNKFEGRNNLNFVSIEVSPSVTSVNNTNITQAQIDANFDLVITGENFTAGDTVSFIGNDNTVYTSPTVTVNSSTQITARVTTSIDAAKEPFSVKVANTGGLSGQLDNAFNINAAPAFATAAGSLGTVVEDIALTSSLNAGATDPEGSSVTHSISSGSLPSGLTLASATGLITGTPNVNDTYASGGVTHSFTVSATDGTNTNTRAFSILRKFADGSTAAAFATSASAIKTLTGTTTNGYYYIKASGMANPVQLWCDMNIDGGGFMRFWWFNTLEQDGSLSGAWQTGTKFGTADISTIPYNQYYGYGRIPSGVTPTKLLVKGTSADQTSTSPPSHLVFTFNSSNSTSNAMLASMQSGTLQSMTQRDQFSPTAQSLDQDAYGVTTSGNVDTWGYGVNLTGGSSGENSFDLNDDAGKSNTTFGAGHDGSSSGTDFVSGGDHPNDDHATGRYLALYWK